MDIKIFERPDVIIISHPRSGTHFLAASLASHPTIHSRGECVQWYTRNVKNPSMIKKGIERHQATNKPGKINIAIVMYCHIEAYHRLCGQIAPSKVMHLLRNPENIARSVLQAAANWHCYGDRYKAHCRVGETALPNAPIDTDRIESEARIIRRLQIQFSKHLQSFNDVLSITYEELTGNQQTSKIPEATARKLLTYLNLEYHPLSNYLKKVG
jgi:hypothetical protein